MVYISSDTLTFFTGLILWAPVSAADPSAVMQFQLVVLGVFVTATAKRQSADAAA